MLIAHLPVVSLAAAIGVGLFYVQHQFEGSRWMRQDGWNPTASALEGSSHLVLPQPLRWLTANIGAHHLHHASSRIPFYRLPKAMAAHPSLATACRLHIRDLGPALSLALWDEIGGRMVTFREAGLSRRHGPRSSWRLEAGAWRGRIERLGQKDHRRGEGDEPERADIDQVGPGELADQGWGCLLYTSPSPRDS